MSTAEILSMASRIFYVLAGIGAGLAVFFWFKFKIPAVIADLSGQTAKKSIEQIRKFNEKSSGQSYKTDAVNEKRKRVEKKGKSAAAKSAKVSPMERKREKNQEQLPETGLLEESRAEYKEVPMTEVLDESLAGGAETDLLGEEQTGLLLEETGMLTEETMPLDQSQTVSRVKLVILEEVMLIHTDEQI